jgi:hypothetical protein
VFDSSMISPQVAEDGICRAVGLFMGRGRAHSVEDVSLGTGIPARTLSAMIASGGDRRCPSGCNLLLLCSFFGVEFTDRLLGVVGQGARDLHPSPDAPPMVIATLMAGAAEFAKAGADGRFCHVDRGELADDAAMMIQILEPFVAPSSN